MPFGIWLKLYKDEAPDELLCVGCVIQSQLKHAPLAKRRAQTTLAYTKSETNTRAALQLLTGWYHGGVLDFNNLADILHRIFRTMNVLTIYVRPSA